MSKETARILHLKVLEDQDLQQTMLKGAQETGNEPDGLAITAQKYNSGLPRGEARAYLDGLANDKYELSEFELELVAAAGMSQSGFES